MKLDRIEIFCAVARNMSFTKAAEECGVAQSAISMQIKALEDELGFPLFERSTRKVSFTDAGQSFTSIALSSSRDLTMLLTAPFRPIRAKGFSSP